MKFRRMVNRIVTALLLVFMVAVVAPTDNVEAYDSWTDIETPDGNEIYWYINSGGDTLHVSSTNQDIGGNAIYVADSSAYIPFDKNEIPSWVYFFGVMNQAGEPYYTSINNDFGQEYIEERNPKIEYLDKCYNVYINKEAANGNQFEHGDISSITSIVIDNEISPTSLAYWFAGFSNVTSITGLENINTNNVTNYSNMFGLCGSLTELDLSKLDNKSGTLDLNNMFIGCTSLETLDISNFVIGTGASTSGMFAGTDLETININSSNTSTNFIPKGTETTSTYHITYELNGGYFVSETVVSGSFSDEEPLDVSQVVPSKDNYEFGGWYLENTFVNSIESTEQLQNNTTIYAKWTPIDYTLTYELDGGTNGSNPSTYNIETATITLNDPTKNGYTFEGWYTESTFTNKITQILLGSTGNKTLYAKWNKTASNTLYAWLTDNNLTLHISGVQPLSGTYSTVTLTDSAFPSWPGTVSEITKVVIEDHIKPTTAYAFFANFNKLATIENISNLDTSNVTSMYYMFYCTGQSVSTTFSLDLSSFDTSKVTNMAYMFSNTGSSAKTFYLDISEFDTSNVTDMSSMFSYTGSGATTFTLDLSKLDTSKVTNMSRMFSGIGCNDSTFDMNLSKFNTSNVTDMSGMFSYAGHNATTFTLDLSKFDTSKVTDMSNMFSSTGYNATTYCLDLSGFNTSNVKNMSYMFSSTGRETTTFNLDLSKFNTSKVTDMSGMFSGSGSKSITFNIDLSMFNTSNVTDMHNMFQSAGYNSTTFTLDLSNFNTSKVTDMSYMFNGAGYNSTSFNLNLVSFDAANVTNLYSIFTDAGTTSTAENWKVFIPYKTGSSTNTASKFYYKSSYIGPVSGKSFTVAAMEIEGKDFNAKLKSLVAANATYETQDSTITSILFDKNYTVPNDGRTVVSLSVSGSIPVYAWRDNETIRITSAAQTIYADTDSSYMFYNFKGVSNKEFTIEADWFDTSRTAGTSYMFANAGYNASKFTIDVSGFDISNVVNVSNMFTDSGNGSTAENWLVAIPQNTGSLTNTTSKLYANSDSVYAVPASGKAFTLVAKLVTGQDFNLKLKKLVNANVSYSSAVDSTITSILFDKSYTVPTDGRTVVDLSV